MRRRHLIAAGIAASIVVTVAASIAVLSLPRQQARAADTGLVTRGDAEAIFHAAYTG